MRPALGAAAALIIAGAAPATAGQQDTTVVRDTTQIADSAQVVDTLASTTGREDVVLPNHRFETPTGPLSPGARHVFTRDSINWSTSQTLGDLLTYVPGVYLARAGFVGQPEYAQYGGRGGSGIELYWDGMPMYAVGSDSLFIDPATIYLRYLRQVEVEVQPSLLRIYLVSERHDRVSPRSLVRAAPGSFKTATYTGLFQNRWRSGVTLDLAAQFVGSDGAPASSRSDGFFDVWAKVGWVPTDGISVSYQIRRQDVDSDPNPTSQGTEGVAARRGTRQDALFSLTAGGRRGLGPYTSAGLAVTSWSPDSLQPEPDQKIRQVFVEAGYRRRSWAVSLRGAHADRRNPYRLDGRVGWVPIPGVVVSGSGQMITHEGDRTSSRAHVSVGLYRGPFAITADASRGSWVQGPAILTDTAIATSDQGVRFHINSRLLTGHVGVVRRDAFAPAPYTDLTVIPAFAPSAKADYLVTAVQVRPTASLMISGWYSDPLNGMAADLQPPKHGRAQITFRSKFWRTFRSGAFDLKLQVATESWSSGTGGLDATGTPILLEGATFWEYHVAVELLGFTAFWNLRNARLTDAVFIPGMTYPQNGQMFGVTWVFAN